MGIEVEALQAAQVAEEREQLFPLDAGRVLVIHLAWREPVHEVLDSLRVALPKARVSLAAPNWLTSGLVNADKATTMVQLGNSVGWLGRCSNLLRALPKLRGERFDVVVALLSSAEGFLGKTYVPVRLLSLLVGAKHTFAVDLQLHWERLSWPAELKKAAGIVPDAMARLGRRLASPLVALEYGIDPLTALRLGKEIPSLRAAYPVAASIEPTNCCILRCPGCETGQRISKAKRGLLSFENFKAILDKLGDHLQELYLSDWGESFLNKDVYRMISYAKERGYWITLDTNANRMNPEALVEAAPDQIVFSIDGVTQESYEKYRVRGNLATALSNLAQVIELKRRLGKKLPKVVFKFIVMKHNLHELQGAEALARRLGVDEFVMEKFTARSAEVALRFQPEDERYTKYVAEELKLGNLVPKFRLDNRCCPSLWNHVEIRWDGTVTPCCIDYDNRYVWGNILATGNLNEIWKGPQSRAFRRANILGQLDMCRNCQFHE